MNRRYSDEFVSKIRGACQAQIPHKVIAKAAGVPLTYVTGISSKGRRLGIPPDPTIREALAAWFKSTNAGAIQMPNDKAS